MTKSNLLTDDFSVDPFWWDDFEEPVPAPDVLSSNVDVAIIGAGYTGLCAAVQTARGGRDTLVLDAEQPGWGCSSRNGGQISTSIKPDFKQLAAKHGPKKAFAILKEGHNALNWIEEFIAQEEIHCDFKVSGRFHGAHNPARYEHLAKALENEPKGLETEAYALSRTDQRTEIDTDAYHGGIVYPKDASVNPAALLRGQLHSARAAGASVMGHCPVVNIEKVSHGFMLTTSKGQVMARDVIVATNGYTGSVTPWQRRRVIPIGSYIIATEPLEEGQMDRLIPNDRVIGDSRKVVFYYRSSPDRTRIIFGGRVSAAETNPLISAPRLHASMIEIFPELIETKISHSWLGFVAYTFDTLAHLGNHNGLHYAMGYCGSGVSMASYLGMRIGQQVLENPEGRTAFDGLPFQSRPFYTGVPWFLSASVSYFRLLDRLGR